MQKRNIGDKTGTLIRSRFVFFSLIIFPTMAPKLKLISPKDISQTRPKATIHKSGKLGFNKDAAMDLGLSPNFGIQMFRDEENLDPLHLYIRVVPASDTDSFKIIKGGEYYYAAAKPFFDLIEADYEGQSYIYTLSLEIIDGVEYWKMTGKITKGRGRGNEFFGVA